MITSLRCLLRSRSALTCLAMIVSVGSAGNLTIPAGAAPLHLAQSATEGISNPELKKYAQALIEIEPLRISALETISKRMPGGLPNLMCHQPESMNSLPIDARKVFVNYCNQSQSIALSYGLGIERFNELTNMILSNPRLQSRLQRQVTCLQEGSAKCS